MFLICSIGEFEMKISKPFLIAIFVLFLYSNPFSQIFTDVANNYGVADTRDAEGAMWLDFDNDGDLDILTACGFTNGKSRLFRNDGNHFTDVAEAVGFGNSHPTSIISISAGDYDNDGDTDLLFYSNGWTLLRNDINDLGVFTDMEGNYGLAVFADFDNDGYLDIYALSFGQVNKLYHNNNDGSFTEVPNALGLNNYGHTRAAVWGDYDNDGDMDVYVVNGRYEKSYLYRNDFNSNEEFVDVTDEMGVGNDYNGWVYEYGNGACWGDYDNDGDLDLYLITLESNKLFRNEVNTTGFFVEVGRQLNIAGSDFTVDANWGDYDNDGDLDLYVINDFMNRLYRNDISDGGKFYETGEMADTEPDYKGGSWGDFDNDGSIDFYLGTRGVNRLYQNKGSDNNWLHIELEGTVSNRSAIGTMAHVYTNELIQTRFVETTSGFGSQNSFALEFGLGQANIVDSIIIKWPSGLRSKFENIGVNQFLNINEDNGITDLVHEVKNFPAEFKLEQNYPNPFNPSTKIKYKLPKIDNQQSMMVKMVIYDILGNEIAIIINEQKAPGDYEVEFSADESLTSGVYFYQLSFGSYIEIKKMMLLK
jgi:hypothetical protein